MVLIQRERIESARHVPGRHNHNARNVNRLVNDQLGGLGYHRCDVWLDDNAGQAARRQRLLRGWAFQSAWLCREPQVLVRGA